MDTLNLLLQNLVGAIRQAPERALFFAVLALLLLFSSQGIVQLILFARTKKRRLTAPTGDFQQQLEFALQQEEQLSQENTNHKNLLAEQKQLISQQSQDLVGQAKEITALQSIIETMRQEIGVLQEQSSQYGSTVKSQSEILQTQMTTLQSQAGALQSQSAAIQKGGQSLERCLQRVGIVRYNSLPEMAGNQSFSVVLLDETRTGMVFTSLQLRQDLRLYAKFVYNGRSEQPLSDEEKQAIAESISLQNNA
jgi:DNA repair exonuclease SbcCD ATPase subunit